MLERDFGHPLFEGVIEEYRTDSATQIAYQLYNLLYLLESPSKKKIGLPPGILFRFDFPASRVVNNPELVECVNEIILNEATEISKTVSEMDPEDRAFDLPENSRWIILPYTPKSNSSEIGDRAVFLAVPISDPRVPQLM